MSNDEAPWQWVKAKQVMPSQEILEEMAKHAGATVEELIATIKALERDEAIWMDRTYQVNIRTVGFTDEAHPDTIPFLHLSIKRRDRGPIGVEHFRHFQRIKNDLVGHECEGIEIYPAESRLVDSANQFHMFVATKADFRYPFGFTDRLIVKESGGGAVQRPFEDDEL